MPRYPYMIAALASLSIVAAGESSSGGIEVLTDAQADALASSSIQCTSDPASITGITASIKEQCSSVSGAGCFYRSGSECTDMCQTLNPFKSSSFMELFHGEWRGCGFLPATDITKVFFTIEEPQCSGAIDSPPYSSIPQGSYEMYCSIEYSLVTKIVVGVLGLAFLCCFCCCCFCCIRICRGGTKNTQDVRVRLDSLPQAQQPQQQIQPQPYRQQRPICPKPVCPKPVNNTNEQAISLPPGWKSNTTPDGRTYYWHESDPGASRTWERPTWERPAQ